MFEIRTKETKLKKKCFQSFYFNELGEDMNQSTGVGFFQERKKNHIEKEKKNF